MADTGPAARSFHAMAYDSDRSRTVLFGGQVTGEFLNDTWEWDGTARHIGRPETGDLYAGIRPP
jgi:hypothetical protein